jgi:hypothetical protein
LFNTEFAEVTESLPKLEGNLQAAGLEKEKSGRVFAALFDTWYYPGQILPGVSA